MRKLLSLLTVLVLALGAVSVFALDSDAVSWNGYYRLKYRYTNAVQDQSIYPNTVSSKRESIMNKLELYPKFQVSENVAIIAGFFTQNFMGNGRLFGAYTGDPITIDTGGHAGSVISGFTYTSVNANQTYTTSAASGSQLISTSAYNTELGVSAAYMQMSFLEGKLGIRAGRLLVGVWGTGAFFGSQFFADRFYVDYKLPFIDGVLIPYFIYERREDGNQDWWTDNMQQLLFGAIYLVPGKTLVGLVINPNFLGKDYAGNVAIYNNNGKSTNYWVLDLYADHKIAIDKDFSIKPILEIAYGTGTIADNLIPGFSHVTLKADFLNVLFKVEVAMKNLFTFIPEFNYISTPKKATKSGIEITNYINPFGINQFCGAEYTFGRIITRIPGAYNFYAYSTALNTWMEYEYPAFYGLKFQLNGDIVSTIVSGLTPYIRFIMVNSTGKMKLNGTEFTTQGSVTLDTKVGQEYGFGISYKLDSVTTIDLDFAMAKWGKDISVTSAIFQQGKTYNQKDWFLGFDVKVKF